MGQAGTRRDFSLSANSADWHLSEVTDTLDNHVEDRYTTPLTPDTAPELIDSVTYNGNTPRFHWQAQPDPVVASDCRAVQTLPARLVAIEVLAGTAVGRVYGLSDEAQEDAGALLLTAVRDI